ncbi:transcriptional regulator [Acetobacter senegalensis]|uniref:Transcriptional regulator n=2 Tax=Acetobacter TaxID=434 RepID=A0A252EHH2_9PROT|nr:MULTISPECIES: LysR family transcriptional regulator [Acetobacter]ATJ89355.1 LysR family transcriptional regulator [Acetobacter tropicalis]OUL65940.1 transcriptional regulator [Acetobacter senegalensis]
MNLRQIEILRAIIRHNTTVAAARVLGLSQPAISNALKAMEEQTGFALFQRVNNRIYPTAEASIIAEDAEALFDLHDKLERRIKDLRESRAGQLRLVATPPIGYGIVTKSIQKTQALRPKIRTYFDVRRYEGVVNGVESHNAELGFILAYGGKPGLQSEKLYECKMVCVMPVGHPLSSKSEITPRDLRDHHFIALERETRLGEATRAVFEQEGEEFNFSSEVRYGNTACALAEAGAGIAVVDPLTAYSGRFKTDVRPFVPVIPITAYAIWSENRSLSRLARFFLDRVKEVIGELPKDLQ